MTTDGSTAALFGILGAVLGAFITGIFSAWVAARGAERQRKQESYQRFLFAASGVKHPNTELENYNFPRMLKEFRDIALVIGSPEVVSALEHMFVSGDPLEPAKMSRLVSAMRQDLGGVYRTPLRLRLMAAIRQRTLTSENARRFEHSALAVLSEPMLPTATPTSEG